jgi:hypothetical protein
MVGFLLWGFGFALCGFTLRFVLPDTSPSPLHGCTRRQHRFSLHARDIGSSRYSSSAALLLHLNISTTYLPAIKKPADAGFFIIANSLLETTQQKNSTFSYPLLTL